MKASHCFIFLVLLIAVRAFPQNAIESVTESPTILEDTVVNANETAINIIPEGGVSNETSISQNPEIIPNEVVESAAGNEGIQSEVSISRDANEILVPTVPREAEVTNATSIVEVSETVAIDAVLPPSEEVTNEVSPIAPSAPAEVDAVNPAQAEPVFENFSLRSIVPSSTTAAPSDLPSTQSVPEVATDIPAPEIVIAVANASLPAISTRTLDSSTSLTEASVSSPSTPVPETTSVPTATEAQVSNISAIIFGDESVVASGSKIPLPIFESAPSTNEVLGQFPDIEVIIPLVDVSMPTISGRSLDAEFVSAILETVPDFSIDSVSSTTEAPASISSTTAISDVESDNAVIPDSSTGSPNFEVAPLPVVSSRALDVEAEAPVNASEPSIITTVTDSANSDIESVSSTTEFPSPANSTTSIPEIVSIAPASDSSVLVSSTGIEELVEIPETSVSEVSSRALDAELPTSTAEASIANVSTLTSGIESQVPTESVPSTTAAPVSEIQTEVPEVVIPVADANASEDASRILDPVVADSESVSSTTSSPEISSSVHVSETVDASDSDVTSSTEVPVTVAPTPSPSTESDAVTTESPVTSQTSSIPCTRAGNFSVPTNCRIYRTCHANGTDLTVQEHECPEGHAFSPVLRCCSRDISPCGDSEPTCIRSGSIADPNTSSAYYWCARSLLGGYHKYHVQCETNEVYVSSISRCLPEALHHSHRGASDSRSDRDIVKAEWKILKKEIKHQAKEDKVRQKLEAKAKAHAEKLATKYLKRQKGETKRHDESDDDDDDEDED